LLSGFSYVILPALVLAVEIAPFIIRTLTDVARRGDAGAVHR